MRGEAVRGALAGREQGEGEAHGAVRKCLW